MMTSSDMLVTTLTSESEKGERGDVASMRLTLTLSIT